jgi:tetratricopeptide (TPR) repeat protein
VEIEALFQNPDISVSLSTIMTNRYDPYKSESASIDFSAPTAAANPLRSYEGNGKLKRVLVGAEWSLEAGSTGVTQSYRAKKSSEFLSIWPTENIAICTKPPLYKKESIGNESISQSADTNEKASLKVSGTDGYVALRDGVSDASESRDDSAVTSGMALTSEQREPSVVSDDNFLRPDAVPVTPTSAERAALPESSPGTGTILADARSEVSQGFRSDVAPVTPTSAERAALPESSPGTGTILADARSEVSQGNLVTNNGLGNAVTERINAIQSATEAFGPRHYRLGPFWCALGCAYFRREDDANAIRAYETALTCTVQLLGTRHRRNPDADSHIETAHSNIGVACWRTGDFSRSVEHFRVALDLRIARRRDPMRSAFVAQGFYQLGKALCLKGDFTEALITLIRAFEIQVRRFGKNSIHLARTLDAISEVHFRNGDMVRSKEAGHAASVIREANVIAERNRRSHWLRKRETSPITLPPPQPGSSDHSCNNEQDGPCCDGLLSIVREGFDGFMSLFA